MVASDSPLSAGLSRSEAVMEMRTGSGVGQEEGEGGGGGDDDGGVCEHAMTTAIAPAKWAGFNQDLFMVRR